MTDPTSAHSTSPSTEERWARQRAAKRLVHYSTSLASPEDLTDLRNADDNTRQDYAGRFAFELLQNGSDAHEKALRMGLAGFTRERRGKMAFVLTADCLLVANTGAPFSHHRAKVDGKLEPVSSLESISRLGESTKRGSEFMGNKGIGFRSIYQVCSRLWLWSGRYRLRYDGRETHRRLVQRLNEQLELPEAQRSSAEIEEQLAYLAERVDRIPMMKVGFWFEPDELPEAVRSELERLKEEGYDTILVLDRSQDERAEETSRFAWDRIAELTEREMLFLDSLERVECTNQLAPERSFTLSMSTPEADIREIVREKAGERDSTRFWLRTFPVRKLQTQRAAVAFRLDEGDQPVPAPTHERVFCTFYPASRERHGFPFYLHSYFHLSPNREYFNTEHQPVERNRDLLDDLADQVVDQVVPALVARFPRALAPEVLLPSLETADVRNIERYLELDESDRDDLNRLTPAGSLTARFTVRVLERLADVPMLHDLRGEPRALTEARLPPTPRAAVCADRLLAKLERPEKTPQGVVAHSESITGALACLKGLAGRFFPRKTLDLSTLASALIDAGVKPIEVQDTADFLYLVKTLPNPVVENKETPLDRLRTKHLRLLACTSGPQPLPEPTSSGKAIRATKDSPLVFFRRLTTGRGGGRPPNLTDLPDFCYVHVVSEEVFELSPDGSDLREVAEHALGLREFAAEDVFRRVAESMFGSEEDGEGLSADQHKELLETILDLLEFSRLRGKIRRRDYRPPRWFMLEEAKPDWELHRLLAHAWIPMAQGWVRGREVILAGQLGDGDPLRAIYPHEQVFLSEGDEAPWLREWLNEYHATHSAKDDIEAEKLEQDAVQFRAMVYQLLGAWSGLRLDVVHHQRGHRNPAAKPTENPHRCVDDSDWQRYQRRQPRSFSSWSFSNCRLVRSAALPHADTLARNTAEVAAARTFLNALGELHRELTVLRWALVRSTAGTTSSVHHDTLLMRQLRSMPWAQGYRDAPPESTLWYSRAQLATTDPKKETHYLRCVTAHHARESLAVALGLPILEEADPKQQEDFVALYEQICQRAQVRDDPAGPGLLTLYRSVVSRLQQIWLGTGKASAAKIREQRKAKAKALARLRAAGVLVHGDKGPRLQTELGEVFYDDRSDANPLFQRLVELVAFDTNSRGMADLLGIQRLSNARVVYDDGESVDFEGYDDIEEAAELAFREMKPALFAFLVHSSTIPAAQRMVQDSDAFTQRWDDYDFLRVEVAPELWVKVGSSERVQVPAKRGVVLEHAPDSTTRIRRIFLPKSMLPHELARHPDGCPPLSLFAPAVANLLGANALVMRLLMQQYELSLESLHAYLVEYCGVDETHIAELAGVDAAGRQEKAEQVEAAMRALRSVLPLLDDDTAKAVRELFETGHDLKSEAVWLRLQQGGVELHSIAQVLGGNPPADNRHLFDVLRRKRRQRCLVHAARTAMIDEPGDAWRPLQRSFDRLHLPASLQWRIGATSTELEGPLLDWMSDHGLDPELLEQWGPEEESLWTRLLAANGGEEDDEGLVEKALVVLRPMLVAVATTASSRPVEELVGSLGELEVWNHTEAGLELSDVRDQLIDWLRLQRVAAEVIEALTEHWPEPPAIQDVPGLDPDLLAKVKRNLTTLDKRRNARSDRKVAAFRRQLRSQKIAQDPEALVLKTRNDKSGDKADDKSGPQGRTGKKKKKPPKDPKKQGRGKNQDLHYHLLGFARRLVGRYGEEFALEVQRRRWQQLGDEDATLCRELLVAIKRHYDGIEDHEDASAWWAWLESNAPDQWTGEEGWPKLRSAIHMSNWRTEAPYDIVGIDREGMDEPWSVYRIEVKATSLVRRMDFPISGGELEEAKTNGDSYVIWRIRGVGQGRKPTWFRLPDPQRLLEEGKLESKAAMTVLAPVVR